MGTLKLEKLDNNEFNFFLSNFAVLYHFTKYDNRLIYYLRNISFNYIEALLFNNRNQAAKDFCEELIILGIENGWNYIGWMCAFRVYSKIDIFTDAAVYGNIFLETLSNEKGISKDLAYETLCSFLFFYRGLGITEFMSQTYENILSLEPSGYKKISITQSYFNGLLSEIFKSVSNEKYLSEILDFLLLNKKEILGYQQSSVIPWLSLLYNIKKLAFEGKVKNFEEFEQILIGFEEAMPKEIVDNLKIRYFGEDIKVLEYFKKTLINSLETRDYVDFAKENRVLNLHMKEVFETALFKQDIEIILLCGYVKNMSKLTFPKKKEFVIAPLMKEKDIAIEFLINNYQDYVKKNLTLRKSQILIWLFSSNGRTRMLVFNPNTKINLIPLPNWRKSGEEKWRDDLSEKFKFPSPKDDDSLNAQENAYLKYLDTLEFTFLNLSTDFDEVLIYASDETSFLPFNLFQIGLTKSGRNYSKHLKENRIQTYIDKNFRDFLGFHYPITNVLYLDWYINKGTTIKLKNDFTISAWIPSAGEMLFAIMERKLVSILEEYNSNVNTKNAPISNLSSDMNIFMLHGEKDKRYGFKSLTSAGNDEQVIDTTIGLDKIFGSGKVAVLFICNSAFTSHKPMSREIDNLVYQIFDLGYNAVIAPHWPLEAYMTPKWLEVFLKTFYKGIKISTCVQEANVAVAQLSHDNSCYYHPAGWASMHLFGNPNISLKKT